MNEGIATRNLTERATPPVKRKNPWIKGEPFTVTQIEMQMQWGLKRGKLRCSLCGYFAKEGDTFRWQFTNDTSGAGGNPMVCAKCDGTKEHIVAVMKSRRHDMQTTHHFFK